MISGFLFTILIAMVPVLELRGAIPYGISAGLAPAAAFTAACIGNILPAPIIILFVRKVFSWMRKRSEWLAARVEWFEARAKKKAAIIYKYELFGLLLLVAVPLPGTGAWTGSLVAALLDIRLKTAFPIIAAGVIIAGVIVTAISCGVFAVI